MDTSHTGDIVLLPEMDKCAKGGADLVFEFVSICILYLHFVFAFCICILYLHFVFAFCIFILYLHLYFEKIFSISGAVVGAP